MHVPGSIPDTADAEDTPMLDSVRGVPRESARDRIELSAEELEHEHEQEPETTHTFHAFPEEELQTDSVILDDDSDALEVPNLAGKDEDEGFEMDLEKRSKLILNWQTICALLIGCGTVRLTAAQFETFRCFVNWCYSRNNQFEDLIPSYSKMKTVLVRCMRKYCWAKSTILRLPVVSERSGVRFGVKDGALAPVRVVLPSSWARLDVATSTILKCLLSSSSAISSYPPVPLFKSIEDSRIVRNRARHTNVLDYAFVGNIGTESGSCRFPIALQENDRALISFQSTQELVQFLRERVLVEGASEGTLRPSAVRVAGKLGAPLIIGNGAVRTSARGDSITQERLAALLSANVEETDSLFCPGDVVFPVDVDSSMANVGAVFMLVYHFQKKKEYAARTTFVTVPFEAIEGAKLSKRLCFISKVLAVSAGDKERVRTDSETGYAPQVGLLKDGRAYLVYRFLLYADDFNPYTTRKGSCGGCYMLPLGVDPENRAGYGAVRFLGLTPPGVSTNSIILSIIPDIVKGATTGFECVDANGASVTVFLDLVGFVGDYPAVTHTLDLLGHTACSPCHLCVFRREEGSGRGASRYGYDTRIHARSMTFVRTMQRTTAARSRGLSASALKELGLKPSEEDRQLPFHELAGALRRVILENRVPLTEHGIPVVPAVFDPYQSCLVAPDHLLSNLAIDVINAAIVSVSPDLRKVAEALILEGLLECGLSSRQNRIFSSSPAALLSMSSSNVFCVLLIAPRAFKNAWTVCERAEINITSSHGARNRSTATMALALLQKFSCLVSATHFYPYAELDGFKAVTEFNKDNGMKRIEFLYSKARKYIEDLNDLCRNSEDARRHLDKPNVHRLVELYVHTIAAFGHVHHVQELVFETAHQPLKRGMQKSNHRDEQVFSVGASLASDWESRLSLEVETAMRTGSPWSHRSCLQIERILLGQCLKDSSTLPAGRTVQEVFEPPVLDVLAAVRRRHCSSGNSRHIWRHSQALNRREALKLTAFPEEALRAAEWYGAFGSGSSGEDTNRSVTWFQESSRYRMQALNSSGEPTWKRRAVVRVGAFLQAVCVSAGAGDRIQFLEHDADMPAPDSDPCEINNANQLTSSLWYVLAFLESTLPKSSLGQSESDEFLLDNSPTQIPSPVAVVVPCSEIHTDEGECHVRVRTAPVPALLRLSSRVRETIALHLCDTGTCIRKEAGRGVIHSPLLDKNTSFVVFDRLRGYPPRIA